MLKIAIISVVLVLTVAHTIRGANIDSRRSTTYTRLATPEGDVGENENQERLKRQTNLNNTES